MVIPKRAVRARVSRVEDARHRLRAPAWLCAAVLLSTLPGCLLDNASPSKKLTDTVYEMNKATRWGSLGMAAQMVEPSYRNRFVETHRHWGQVVQVADTEVMQIQIDPGTEDAVAVIAYQWYQMDMMTLHETVVQQRWTNANGNYGLASEMVVKGDPRLLHPTANSEQGMGGPGMDADSMSLMYE